MLAIENSRKNRLTLNLLYDILAELHNLEKQITPYKVFVHTGIKGYEETDKAAKRAIYMPGMTITRLPYTDYYLTIRRARTSNGKAAIVRYTILNHAMKNEKVQAIRG